MRLSRRRFLARGGAAGLGLFALPSARAARTFQAHERLNFAVVGVAGYAAATAFVPALHLYENVGVTALCDVDERKIPRVYEIWKERAATAEVYRRLLESRPKFFADFRRMLDEMGDAIDAVVVATPDHSHAVIAAAALRA
ncbi:MAG: Gfo/Idh/MocA family oxidoreductase, partial [Planctomycetota bacterium]